jgi:ElaA protein
MMKDHSILIKAFADLSPLQLYQIMQLRNEVFIVEQNCVYQDIDDKDQYAFHVMHFENEQLAGYTRLMPVDINYKGYSSIGRVVTKQIYREHGIGKQIMQASIDFCKANFNANIKISAQQYLEEWYAALGFKTSGGWYWEDNIPHVPMVYHL